MATRAQLDRPRSPPPRRSSSGSASSLHSGTSLHPNHSRHAGRPAAQRQRTARARPPPAWGGSDSSTD
jgi:hypothetical protein